MFHGFGTTVPQHHFPKHLLFQWHITERCNLRCAHCYQESHTKQELDFDQLLFILDQYRSFLNEPVKHGLPPMTGHITITGGEPFIRNYFKDLLKIFASHHKQFSFAVLTNGTLIDLETAIHLKKLKPRFVQVSLEGPKETHDRIREIGNFEKTLTAIKNLVRCRIRVMISFTAHQMNYRGFPEVAAISRKLKVYRVWADRLIPQGRGRGYEDLVLSPEQTLEFFNIMKQSRNKIHRTRFYNWFSRTEIAMHRALQFLVSGDHPYHCTAGDTLITVQPNGDLLPCRRMPIKVGNLLETPLVELYQTSALFQKLRNPECMDEICKSCRYGHVCRGGLRCLSYAVSGDPFGCDPGCFI